ncbi:hypothetical protein K402DRAFT_424603 [Aulographum hederae CBS 113979]|uniref:SnoaL-like domain-containing protein n=1 Tax=Aulographum hederae CBS 113979 TaxID=1176131 RepID=A0A6G1GNC5_9PEZI|nr:hypothetical protein K402DRAFT_424603 [Aulographum hederae CBS 113979]
MPPHKKHADHDHIVKRLEEYIKAYRTGKPEALMEFYHPEDFVYSDFGAGREGMRRSEVKEVLHQTFNDFHDLKIKTVSIHGHKNFTAWEWEITCKSAIEPDSGKRLKKEEAPPKKLIGCTLMWWDEDDKIVKNHDYVQTREPEADAK